MYDTGTPSGLDVAYMNVVHADDNGNPIVVWNWKSTGQVKATKWTGSSWRTTAVPATYAFDVVRTGPDAFKVYKKTPEGDLQILLTTDGGVTWRTDSIVDVPTSFHRAATIDRFNPAKSILLQEDKPLTGLAMWVAGTGPAAPAAPTGLTAAALMRPRGSIKLTWNAVSGAASYG